jgi:hypothetical protein
VAILQNLRGIIAFSSSQINAVQFKPHEMGQLGATPWFGRAVALPVSRRWDLAVGSSSSRKVFSRGGRQ